MSKVMQRESGGRGPLYEAWAAEVKRRAHWTCEGCRMTESDIRALGGTLQAAHVLPFAEYAQLRFDPSNGRALCTFPNRRHPGGLGKGYGCHNAMSGHWGNGNATGPPPSRRGSIRGLVRSRSRHPFLMWVAWSFLSFPLVGLAFFVMFPPPVNVTLNDMVKDTEWIAALSCMLPVVIRVAWRSRILIRRRNR